MKFFLFKILNKQVQVPDISDYFGGKTFEKQITVFATATASILTGNGKWIKSNKELKNLIKYFVISRYICYGLLTANKIF